VKPFDTLIRLSEQQLDDKRRVLAAIEDRLDAARQARAAIETELEAERQRASGSGEVAFGFGAYMAEVINRRQRAEADIARIEAEADAAREEVRTAFAELKRYEITHQKKLAEIAKEQAMKQQDALDEIALQLDRRKGDRL